MFPDLARLPRLGLAARQVLAIVIGLTVEMGREALVPGLAPLIALALLAAPGPLGIGKGAALAVMVSAMAVGVLGLSLVALSTVGVYAITVTVLYAWAFHLCFSPKTAAIGRLFLMMAVSVSALAAGSGLLAQVIVLDMIASIAVGVGLVLAVQALAPPARESKASEMDTESHPVASGTRTLVATAIMVPAHLFLTFDGIAAIVILLTAATMLTEPGWGRFKAYGAVFAGGNLIGGVLALAAATVTVAQPAFAVFASTVAACAAVIAYFGIRPGPAAPFLGPAASAFALLFGMTLSPLATGADVEVITRVAQILVAVAYVLGATSLGVALMEYLDERRYRDGAAARSN